MFAEFLKFGHLKSLIREMVKHDIAMDKLQF